MFIPTEGNIVTTSYSKMAPGASKRSAGPLNYLQVEAAPGVKHFSAADYVNSEPLSSGVTAQRGDAEAG